MACCEGTEGKWRYSCTLSAASALEECGWVTSQTLVTAMHLAANAYVITSLKLLCHMSEALCSVAQLSFGGCYDNRTR
jgi:hypothetical protein